MVLACASRNDRYFAICVSVNIHFNYKKNKQQEQTINTRNKSFQQYETTYLDKKECFPLENS